MTEAEWRNSLNGKNYDGKSSILDGKLLYQDAFETQAF